MKFQSILSFATTAGIVLGAAQQSAAIVNALRDIDGRMSEYRGAIRDFNGSSTSRLLEREHDLTAAFRSNRDSIEREGKITIKDVFEITKAVEVLERRAKEIHQDLGQKRAILFNIGQGPATRFLFEHWKERTKEIDRSISNKLAAEDRSIVKEMFEPTLKKLSEIEREFTGDELSWRKGTANHTARHLISSIKEHAVNLNNIILNEREKHRRVFDSLKTFNAVLLVSADRLSDVRGIAIDDAGPIQGFVVPNLWADFEPFVRSLVTRKDFFINNGQGAIISFALQSYLVSTKTLVDAISYTFGSGLQAASANDMFRTPERLIHDALQVYETYT